MKHIVTIIVLAALLAFSLNVPPHVSVIFVHLLMWSMLLHIVGYGFYLTYTHCKKVAADLEEHTQRANLRMAMRRIEAKLKRSDATHWGRVETWRQYCKLAQEYPQHIKQALKFSAVIEKELDRYGE
jgi:hypothetical protein